VGESRSVGALAARSITTETLKRLVGMIGATTDHHIRREGKEEGGEGVVTYRWWPGGVVVVVGDVDGSCRSCEVSD
jgi:hypothetical protein